jgi:hypothetical protein
LVNRPAAIDPKPAIAPNVDPVAVFVTVIGIDCPDISPACRPSIFIG